MRKIDAECLGSEVVQLPIYIRAAAEKKNLIQMANIKWYSSQEKAYKWCYEKYWNKSEMNDKLYHPGAADRIQKQLIKYTVSISVPDEYQVWIWIPTINPLVV